ncbi:hypothetical protein IF655_01025 [Streptomyces sp. DSM 110735]|uniref:hypothetical protein n=1 Tax=Streptomyces sp. DSM 110735 TaxID=2775031 RepID=UPI0018F2E22E|nr:hypothetical protein [Streptomyces sp. DSM 110735]MBJ7901884.1 hypothetical protein [Streptomyces sp. DSM 110735]
MTVGTTRHALIEQGHWLTVRNCKRVLVVVHTMTFAQRLREVFELLEADFRIQMVFTAAPHAFGLGVAQYLEGLGITSIPWEEARRSEFDLALVAGSRGVHELRAPVVRISHGAGHIKLLTDTTMLAPGERRWPGMLSRQHLLHGDRVVPTAIAYAHERDLADLRASCPEALPAAHVVGDPCVDRILAARSWRKRYRRALGITPGQRLVVINSTWGATSTFGQLGSLLPHLVSRSLGDGYRVALLIHPNVFAGHGRWQVRGWLASCSRSGVAIVPPEADWQSLLVAADWVLGDHGSLTAYGSLTEATVLLTPGPKREISASSPAALLAAAAPVISPAHPLTDQLEYAARVRRPGQYDRVAAALSSVPGQFHRRMRSLLYRLLGLSEPAHPPAVTPLPAPPPLEQWVAAPAREEVG